MDPAASSLRIPPPAGRPSARYSILPVSAWVHVTLEGADGLSEDGGTVCRENHDSGAEPLLPITGERPPRRFGAVNRAVCGDTDSTTNQLSTQDDGPSRGRVRRTVQAWRARAHGDQPITPACRRPPRPQGARARMTHVTGSGGSYRHERFGARLPHVFLPVRECAAAAAMSRSGEELSRAGPGVAQLQSPLLLYEAVNMTSPGELGHRLIVAHPRSEIRVPLAEYLTGMVLDVVGRAASGRSGTTSGSSACGSAPAPWAESSGLRARRAGGPSFGREYPAADE